MILLAFLFPVAVYCLVLAFVNRSSRPVAVAGTWDVLGLLLACSGFLLLGGPAVLNGLYSERRLAWALGEAPVLFGIDGESWYFWVALWAIYFTTVLVGATLLLWSRRRVTSVYNVEPSVFAEVLTRVLDQGKVRWTRSGDHVVFHAAEGSEAVLRVDVFPAMHHVSLVWGRGTAGLRREVEGELLHALARVPAGYNPAGTWLLALALCLFALTCFGLVLFLVGLLVRWLR